MLISHPLAASTWTARPIPTQLEKTAGRRFWGANQLCKQVAATSFFGAAGLAPPPARFCNRVLSFGNWIGTFPRRGLRGLRGGSPAAPLRPSSLALIGALAKAGPVIWFDVYFTYFGKVGDPTRRKQSLLSPSPRLRNSSCKRGKAAGAGRGARWGQCAFPDQGGRIASTGLAWAERRALQGRGKNGGGRISGKRELQVSGLGGGRRISLCTL